SGLCVSRHPAPRGYRRGECDGPAPPSQPNPSKKRRRQRRLSIVHRHAAGIDIGSTFHVVAVPADRTEEAVRTFQSFTGDLHRLADWLQEVGVTTVAMESTGVYWIP